MPSTDRRAFLAGLGGFSGILAGCVGVLDSGTQRTETRPDTATDTRTPAMTETRETIRRTMGESVAIDGMKLTVEHPGVRKQVISQGQAHDWLRADETSQYLIVDVPSWRDPEQMTATPPQTPPASVNRFDVVLDGQPVPVGDAWELAQIPGIQTPATDGTYQRWANDESYVTGVGIPVPVEAAETAAIRWPGNDRIVHWELGAEVRQQLAQSPDFELDRFDIGLTEDDAVEIAVEVSNRGSRTGIWLAWYSTRDFSGRYYFSLEVPGGETRARTVRTEKIGPGSFAQFQSAETEHEAQLPESE